MLLLLLLKQDHSVFWGVLCPNFSQDAEMATRGRCRHWLWDDSVSLHTFNIINLLGSFFFFSSYDLGQKQFLPLKHVKYSVITVNIEQYRDL